jgi:hypothetical protein
VTDLEFLAGLRDALARRFAARPPHPLVVAASSALGRFARALPAHSAVRTIVRTALGPLAARVILGLGGVFGGGVPGDERSPFVRAAHRWFGVESSAMVYDRTWRVVAADRSAIVERVYAVDDRGVAQAGCPWGMSAPDHAFACRTVMLGSRDVFATIGSSELMIDIAIPEMRAAAELARRHIAATSDRDPDRVFAALEPALHAIFDQSQPEEPAFFVDGRLRSATAAVLRALIAALIAGREPAIFCQFRLVPADRLHRRVS